MTQIGEHIQMNLSKKTLTRLLNASFRKSILREVQKNKRLSQMGIFDAAKYFVDSQIIQKMQGHDNDKKSGWGFPQLNILCAVKDDGSVEKKLFEFKTVNHFLKDKDGDAAVEVVACILAIWAKNDKTVANFNYEKIDAELVKLDQEAKELKEREERTNQTGKKIKEQIEPFVSQLSGVEYGEACKRAQEDVTKVLEKMKADKEVFSYALTFTRNTKESIAKKQLFIDISFKCDPRDAWVVLACHVDGNKKNSDESKEAMTESKS